MIGERELGPERFGADEVAADLAFERDREERLGVSDDIELGPTVGAAPNQEGQHGDA